MTHRRTARTDPQLRPVLGPHVALTYGDGGAQGDDRPAHVRAASALRWQGTRLVVVQDDTHVLVLRESIGAAGHVLLDAPDGVRVFDDTRGNKAQKLDLEACVALPDGRVVAFGSGSKAARERLVVLEGRTARIVDARALYAKLRACSEFAGSELNLEGALVVGDRLRLFQRGNGAPRAGLGPVNATVDLSLEVLDAVLADRPDPLTLHDVVQYDLGQVRGIPFGFTDAALCHDGRVAFVACVEASPDAVRDGEVLGCRFGFIEGDQVRMADVLEADLTPTRLKLEGLEARPGAADLYDVVADMDAPDEPAVMAALEVKEA